MLLKLILIGVLGYFLVRLVFKPAALKESRRNKIPPEKPDRDDYIEYEEVE